MTLASPLHYVVVQMKNEVYSWRVSTGLKKELEDEARREGLSLAELLERLAREGLEAARGERVGEVDEQQRLQRSALRAFGLLAGGDPRRAERAKETLRKKLKAKRAG
ncbi:MAG: hypothetical protein ACOZIN_04710 [Myxococcota bacterium]